MAFLAPPIVGTSALTQKDVNEVDCFITQIQDEQQVDDILSQIPRKYK
jgi:hypothetical protein